MVTAYHGCDADVAARILRGDPLQSQNDNDWLGAGIYFWEYGADRALQFARDRAQRGKVRMPAIVGALIQLGHCFDLMDTRFTDELPVAFELFQKLQCEAGEVLPKNAGNTPDKKLQRLDCAVLNLYFRTLENDADSPIHYDTVRCGFVEGQAAFQGSGIRHQSHVQLAVRNPACVIGAFRPTLEGRT
jgi:hypothetical protein